MEDPDLSDIDRFILVRLQEQGLDFSPPASPAHWLRRVSFDLTGSATFTAGDGCVSGESFFVMPERKLWTICWPPSSMGALGAALAGHCPLCRHSWGECDRFHPISLFLHLP